MEITVDYTVNIDRQIGKVVGRIFQLDIIYSHFIQTLAVTVDVPKNF